MNPYIPVSSEPESTIKSVLESERENDKSDNDKNDVAITIADCQVIQ